MDTKKQAALAAVENKKELLQQVADSIWAYAELSLQEYRSAALYEQVLEEEGFTVEKGICGIETAFSSSFGSGRPVIGILGEYDALSGLSQAGYAIKETPLAPGAPGHGCGHNLLGAGALGAALGVKAYLEETGGPGTVIFYGCPGEEGGAAHWKNHGVGLVALYPDLCQPMVQYRLQLHHLPVLHLRHQPGVL